MKKVQLILRTQRRDKKVNLFGVGLLFTVKGSFKYEVEPMETFEIQECVTKNKQIAGETPEIKELIERLRSEKVASSAQ